MDTKITTNKELSIWEALIPVFALIGMLAFNVFVFGDSALGGSNQFVLLLGGAVAAIMGFMNKVSYKTMLNEVAENVKSTAGALLILLMVGALAGTWLVSGVIPAMIYYGLQILSPAIFLPATLIICSVISIATGSSWTTSATVGIALIGIGGALGFDLGMVAGAVISGAYFGDKMSPLSDTTNLAPAMAGTDLFTHIRYMALTTVPTITITLIVFLIMGFFIETKEAAGGVETLLQALEQKFYISPILFLVPAIVIFMIVKKVDALPALLIGSLLGGIAAIICQPDVVKEVSGITNDYGKASYMALMNAMGSKLEVVTTNDSINELLSTKGMSGMLNTIWLIVCAMCFGGVMEACGLLHKITSYIVKLAKSTGSLIATTAGTCVFFNATASDQYLAIVVPGRMFAETYHDRGLQPQNLSRTLEDSGTVTSVLFPWNTCGATQASVLGVATGTYWMYCFFNLLSPLMTMFFGFLNIRIAKRKVHVD